MPLREQLLTVLVTVIWGVNFVFIKIGVQELPPLMLTAVRFFFTAVPAIFFVPWPKTQAWRVIAYGLALGVGQFGLVITAIALGMPAGMASMVIQTQIFFTMGLAFLIWGEQPRWFQLAGALIAFAGVGLIGWRSAGGAQFWPFAMTILSAMCWACANAISKSAGKIELTPFIVWTSLISPLPLAALSYAFEGTAGFEGLLHPSWTLALVVFMLSWPATLFGFGMWSWLLARYPAAIVTPYALLVPVWGLLSASIWFHEPLTMVDIVGGALVMAGLVATVYGGRIARLFAA